jgi:hypothetical protein
MEETSGRRSERERERVREKQGGGKNDRESPWNFKLVLLFGARWIIPSRPAVIVGTILRIHFHLLINRSHKYSPPELQPINNLPDGASKIFTFSGKVTLVMVRAIQCTLEGLMAIGKISELCSELQSSHVRISEIA